MQRVEIFSDRDIGRLEKSINESLQSNNEIIANISHTTENNYHTVIVVFEKVIIYHENGKYEVL